MITVEKFFMSVGYGMLTTLIVFVLCSFGVKDATHDTAMAVLYLAAFIGIMVFMFVMAVPSKSIPINDKQSKRR